MHALRTAAPACAVAAILAATPLAEAKPRPKPPAAPTVSGPLETASLRPVYRFAAARAVSFRCAFDSTVLHRCAARYSQRLAPGDHVLRVRAVGGGGALSRVVSLTVRVLEPLPPSRPARRSPSARGRASPRRRPGPSGCRRPATGGSRAWPAAP